MLITEPGFCGSMRRPAARMQKKTPRLHDGDRVVPVLVGHVLRVRAERLMPALLTTMSTGRSRGRPVEHRLDLVSLRDVRRIGTRLDTEPCELSAARGRRRVDLGDGDAGSGLCQLLGDAAAEPRARTRDDRDSTLEHSHSRPPQRVEQTVARRFYTLAAGQGQGNRFLA